MRYYSLVLLCLSTCITGTLYGQTSGKDLVKDNISKTSYAIDTDAAAVILYESNGFEVNTEIKAGGHQYMVNETQTVHRIIKILKTDALHVADVRVFYSDFGDRNFINKVKATTYNKVGNDIVATQVEKSSIYTKEVFKNYNELSFSLPQAKEGSIIEYSYEISSPFRYRFPTWDIQDLKYPKLVTIYGINCPDSYLYTTVSRVGALMVEYPSIDDALHGVDDFCHTAKTALDPEQLDPNHPRVRINSFWLRRNIPALKAEPYVECLANYAENMQLQYTGYRTPAGTIKREQNTWTKLNKLLLENDYLGGLIFNPNNYLDAVTDSIKRAHTDTAGQIKAVYDYVRNNYTATTSQRIFSSHQSLREICSAKHGTTSEINLLLCALLRHAGIEASPLILATTDNQSLSHVFPIYEQANYVACAVPAGTTYLLLDASDKFNVYGMLPPHCYNGYARILTDTGNAIFLSPNTIKNKKVVAIRINEMTDTGCKIEITIKPGIFSSSALRKKWADNSASRAAFLEGEKNQFGGDITNLHSKIAFEQDPDTNLVITFKGAIKFDLNSGTWFLPANIAKTFLHNPFTAAERRLPIEFPYTEQRQYYFAIELPPGISPDSLSPPQLINFEDNGITYKRTCAYYKDLHSLTVSSILSINGTSYPAADYDPIRNFYQEIMRQENEVITLKKTTGK